MKKADKRSDENIEIKIEEKSEPWMFNFNELENLVNFLTISGTSSKLPKGLLASISFRPTNLPKKDPNEEDHHKKLVEKNRMLYIKHIKNKEKELEKKRLDEEKREKRVSELTIIWEKEILEHWDEMKNTQRVRELWLEGIPPKIRGHVWQLCLGNFLNITRGAFEICKIKARKARELYLKLREIESHLYICQNENLKKNLQEEFNSIKEKLEVCMPSLQGNKQKSIAIIENDIPRTFPTLGIFRQGGLLYEQLQDVLESFIFYQPRVGYIQGMSYIGAHFLLYMNELSSFTSFTNLINRNPFIPFYMFDEGEIQKIYMLFKQVFKHNLTDLCFHFEDENIQPKSYLFEWFMTFYTRALDINLVSKIWDLYFLDGTFVVYQAAIAILKICEKDLLKGDFEEILSVLKNASKYCTNEDEFINTMYDVSVPNWLYEEIIINGMEKVKRKDSVLTTDTIFS